ncbi:MAG: efflux transporter outer membrane subunit [Deltaproteobacteria bacterium]|jgi:multidrug efflux system outer membrane protein|nr:efflux transporter outer membrane subunit [Deltaproteobacteria bacterium]
MVRGVVFGSLGLLLLVAGGCKLTPDYERPELDSPEGWVRTENTRESIANVEWWKLYHDETLMDLIELALEENQDLLLAMARMEEAEYLVTSTRADQFPFLDIFGSAERGRPSREIIPNASTENRFNLGATLSFELDLWSKYARATEGARADLLSTEAAYRNVTISLIADVAGTYLLLRDFDARLEISKRTVRSRQDRLDIIRARFEKGTVPEIDVNQSEVQLAIAEAAVAQFERQVAQAEHALRVLVGRYPGPIPRGAPIGLDTWSIDVPAGLPSELLERRPDVVEAEQRLIAETARVGVAQAMRFPAISLTANVAAVAEDLTDLNSTDAGQWNVLAGIFQPIFNSGRLKAQMKAQRARAQQSQHAYVRTLQNAFREVEDSLVGVQTYRSEHAARRRQVDAAANTLRLSEARYDGGVVDYLEVLDSERTLFDAELEESSTRRLALVAFVTLYKALGGGWSPEDEDAEGEGRGGKVPDGAVADAAESPPVERIASGDPLE